MTNPKPITIIGGGLAGLALGIALRRREIPVEVWEAGSYPRHRVCGEFISGGGLDSLERMGMRDLLVAHGARWARNVRMVSGALASRTIPLPRPALCLSRFRLDALMAEELRRLGGTLCENERWRGEILGDGVVRATGRKPAAVFHGWRWVGLKAHAREVFLSADLEMHFLPNGYVGVSRLSPHEVNVCGLFRSRVPLTDLAGRWSEYLTGPAESSLAHRLRGAQWEEGSFCSVAGLSFDRLSTRPTMECAIGDALGFIPPFTGNGMSVAFESAELAVDSIAKFSHGELSWSEAREEIARRCGKRFTPRMHWAYRLQTLLFQPVLRAMLARLLLGCPQVFQTLFFKTR